MKTIFQTTAFAIIILLAFGNLNVNAQNPPPQNFSINPISSVSSWESPVDANPIGYKLFLADSLVAELADTTFIYTLECLLYGTSYTANLIAVYESGESEAVSFSWTSLYLKPVQQPFTQYTPGSDEVQFHLANIQGCDDGSLPDRLISFNIYHDGEFTANVPTAQGDEFVIFIMNNLSLGLTTFCTTAVYDLGNYGLPGETGESVWVCEDVNIVLGMELPFFEDWQSGSFETNQWETNGDYWEIDTQTGNPEPAARFFSINNLSNYSFELKSSNIDASVTGAEQIYFDFDLKLLDNNATATEKLLIQVFDGSSWHTVNIFKNTGSFDWTKQSFNITKWAEGKIIKLRFLAAGENSFNFSAWLIDNIEVYRNCNKPEELTGEVYSTNYPQVNGSELRWSAPERSIIESGWKHYDSGENTGAIGGPVTANAAIRWDNNILKNLHGDTLEKIKFFLVSNVEIIVAKVWNDTVNINDLIYSDTLEEFSANAWNVHTLEETIIIDSTKQLLVGYSFYSTQSGIYPLGHDEGPAVKGYGDLISLDGITWDYISDFGPDFNVNWNIQMFVDTVEVSYPIGLEGFNILKKEPDEEEYHQIDFVEFHNWKSRYSIIDTCYDAPYTCDAFYKVNALWVSDGDTCISDFAPSLNNPENDFVYVMFVDIEENEMEESELIIFPNPTSNILRLKLEEEINTVIIFNSLGQIVKSISPKGVKELSINVSSFKSGVYFVKVETEKGILSKKFIKK